MKVLILTEEQINAIKEFLSNLSNNYEQYQEHQNIQTNDNGE